ncbi:MAG: PspA/IM30 family protein [Spirochaetales bacterium]|jgi:phage shock protein A|nr:PspA/IM30 family protein [Spirochaetales bacterium]MCR5442664.1 PspA/IM30 family protein [Sphaerochaetaceae bacterium]MBQ6124697.1 PspA/IM30 family protein [Spirochaetales bacterium]MBQ7728968.1 PspA/IM30 family protein [Spirochaetales bacterium]MBQ9810789.1 PspA/IM30 family protein [Spirochaetales bacterium]
MNVFKRIHDIFSSNVNHALDKMEDPAKMIRYTIVEMENSLAKAKDSAAQTLANIRAREVELKSEKEAVARWEVRAQLAVKNGKDDLAREAISEKQTAGAKVTALETEIAELKNINASQEAQIVKLTEKLEEVKGKERTLVARAQHAKEKIKIEKQISSTDCGAAIKRFNEMEEKVERLEAEAAVASKNYENEAKFTEMESNDSIDKELAELKAKINGSVVAAEPAEAPASQAKKG